MAIESIPILSVTDKILQDRGLLNRREANFDAATFIQSYQDHEAALLAAPELLSKNLTKDFEDAFLRPRVRDYSLYEDRYSMPEPHNRFTQVFCRSVDDLDGNKIVGGKNARLSFEDYRDDESTAVLDTVFYGPDRLYRLEPNDFVYIPKSQFGQFDLVGSNAFTACTAIAVKTENGYFFAHITSGPMQVRGMLAALRSKFGDSQPIKVIRPQWTVKGEIVDDYERNWRFLADDPHVEQHHYAYIDVGSDRPADTNESTIVMTMAGVRVIGSRFYKYGDHHSGQKDIRELDHDTAVEYRF